MSLRSFLTRLIWLCVLPLVLLTVYLAIDSVRTTQSQRDLEAASLAKNFAIAVPGLGEGKPAFFVLTIFETRQFQGRHTA